MTDQWVWAAMIAAAPFVLFGLLELAGALRRKREIARAHRPKQPGGGRDQRSMRRLP